MKNFSVKFICAVIFLLAQSCNLFTHKKESVVTSKRAVKAPVAFAFLDANRLQSIRIPNVKITLIDAGRQVVTPNYLSFSTLDVDGGVCSLALKDSAVYNRDRPYTYTLNAESPGYISSSRSVVITSDSAQYVVVFMVKIEDPPAGMAGFNGNISIKSSTITKNTVLSPAYNNKLTRKVSINIPEGTVLLSNKERLNPSLQSITCKFIYATPTIESLRTFPGSNGGTLITNAIDSTGKTVATPQNPIDLISTGWLGLEMGSGKEKVTGFSKPVQLNMPIEKGRINPVTSKTFKIGDIIPTWSLSDQGIWKQESTAQVIASDDGLIAVINISHLSFWNLDTGAPVCSTIKTIPYTNSTSNTIKSYCELVSMQNGLPFTLRAGYDPVIDFSMGSGHHDINNLPSAGDYRFLVYTSNGGPMGAILASSDFNCATTTPPGLTLGTPVVNDSIRVDFQYIDAANNRKPICKNAVFFLGEPSAGCTSVSGSAWNYGGMLTGSAGTNVGTTTLHQPTIFGRTCIRLFYGKSTSTPVTVSYQIDFRFDLSLHDGVEHTLSSTETSLPGITYQSFGTGAIGDPYYFQITIPYDATLAAVTSCP